MPRVHPEPERQVLGAGVDNIESFGKGAIPEIPVFGSQPILNEILGAPIIDWNTPYRVPVNLTTRDQKSSSSCTAQATGYYVEALNQVKNRVTERYSARHIYSQVFAPGGGAHIWKAMSIPVLQGAASAASVPDGDSKEATMTDATQNFRAVIESKAFQYAQIPRANQGIDFLAQIIKNYHGFVTGFNGWNGMFAADGTVVNWSKNYWGHAVFCLGHEKRNGVKCLVFKNSWGNWGDNSYGYFPETFVNSGMMFDAYVYASVSDINPSTMFSLVQVSGSDDVYVVKGNKKTLVYNQGALLAISEFSAVVAITQKDLDAIPDSGVELAALVK